MVGGYFSISYVLAISEGSTQRIQKLPKGQLNNTEQDEMSIWSWYGTWWKNCEAYSHKMVIWNMLHLTNRTGIFQ